VTDKSNKGQAAETTACAFLEKQGLRLLEKNFSCPCGEIDLIMQDQEMLVFVEVRLRQHSHLGSAIESVTRPKQKRLLKAALLYLQKKRCLYKIPYRFDIIGMDGNKPLEWLKNAFSADF
jgi:putative endonuclease